MQPAEKVPKRVPRTPIVELTVGLYQGVIDRTISQVKSEFVQEGVDESILEELRRLWEVNLVKTGVVGEAAGPSASPHQQWQAAAPAASPMMALPTAPMPFSTQPGAGYAALPHPAAASAFPLGVPPLAAPPMPAPAAGFPAVAAAVAAERKRQLDVMAAAQGQPPAKQAATGPAPPPGAIPQRDGPADEAEPAVGPAAATGDDGGAGTSAAAAAADGEEALGAGDDDDDEALGEDDDLADVDAEEVDEGDVRNVVTGVFDKVHRAKGRWKVFAKHCVATINGRDYLLKKVTGEMQFQ